MKNPFKIEVDENIMSELLSAPSVAKSVRKMTHAELEFFKETLVSQGVYSQFVLEKQKAQVKQSFKKVFERSG